MSVMHTEMDKGGELRMEWDPFSDDQVEGLFFPGADRAEQVEQLLHMLRYGTPLTLLVGATGVGKRTLLNHLVTQMDPDLFDMAVINAHVMLDFAGLLSQLDEPWRSLRPFTVDNYLELIPAVAAAADEESKTLLCIIPGAQLLDADVIRSLQGMLVAAAGLPVKCLLLVDAVELESAPAVHAMLEVLPDSTVMYLDPFTPEQTEAYLQYRMHVAGLGQISFSPEQVQRIHDQAHGIAADINAAARELLLEAMPAPKSTVAAKPPLPWMHLGALGLVLVVLGVLFWSRPDGSAPSGTPAATTIVLEDAVQPEPVVVESPFTEVAKVAAESALQEPALQPQPAPEASAAPTATAPSTSAMESASRPTVAAAQASVATTEPTPPEPAVPRATEPEPVSPPVVAQKPVEAPRPAVTPVSPADARVAWLKGLPRDHYVLQLLGANEEATVKRFLGQYPSLRKVAYYKTWRQGQPWFVVVQGDYATYDAAKAGIATLPSALRNQNPWIRKVEVIQQQLGAR